MGNSLHNKIYLGRTTALSSGWLKAALLAGLLASVGLTWIVLAAFK